MVAISSVMPLIPNINVGENERLSFHTVSQPAGDKNLGAVLTVCVVAEALSGENTFAEVHQSQQLNSPGYLSTPRKTVETVL